jgi:hypothetical protein
MVVRIHLSAADEFAQWRPRIARLGGTLPVRV